MWRIAYKMLTGDRLKYFGLIAGIAFASLLVAQQASILIGFSHQTGAFIRDTAQADLWLMDSQGLKEQEAFRKIQQLSMNSRKSMREIAQAILLTAQIDK